MAMVVGDHYGPSLESLTKLPPRCDGVRFWWLGQAGFAIEALGHRILIDPYLSDSLADKYRGTLFPHERLHPSPIAASTLVGIDAVFHTHAHTDHLDPVTIAALQIANDPTFIAPRAVRSTAFERGIPEDRFRGIGDGERFELTHDISAEAIASAHEVLDRDDSGDHRHLGYVFDFDGIRIYHSGDCVPYPGLVERLRTARIDVALLPINGRDSYRLENGVPGNFRLEEAVDIAHDARIPALVGHHFGLFDFNTVDLKVAREQLRESAGDLEWTLPSLGATYRLHSGHQENAPRRETIGEHRG
jgi:L-ascorbate metabolism protein UlaG (beta-lactamase superfamily)